MSVSNTPKDINRIRTFANDMIFVKRSQGTSEKTEVEHTPPPAANKVATANPIVLKNNPNIKPQPHTNPASEETQIDNTNIPSENGMGQKFAKNTVSFTEEIAQIARPHKESILSDNSEKVYEGGGAVASGTIIRDTKRKRFKLLPAILEATTSWFHSTKDEYEKSHHQTYAVANADSRISTIKKAVERSERAPKSDSKIVVDRLKAIERAPIKTGVTVKEKEKEEAPSWAYTTDTPSTDTPTETTTSESTHPSISVADEKLENNIPTAQAQENTNTIEEPAIEESPTIYQEPAVQIETVPEATVPAPRAQYAPPQNKQNSLLPIFILIGVVIVASLLGVGLSYYFFAEKNTDTKAQEKKVVFEIPSLIQAQNRIALPLTNERVALLESIAFHVTQNSGIIQIYPTVQSGDGVELPAPAEVTLQVLALRTPGTFNRSVKEITFGGVNQSQPFIILKTTSFDTAFAGMLDWEKSMSADLSPLFGNVVTETFDPQARTATQVRDAFFKDTIASNKNVRLLLDESGEDRIVYTFINQHTILITTTRDALEALIPLIP